MTLDTALLIAKDCGLSTVGEAIFNIEIHAMSIFNYGEIDKELNELKYSFKNSGLSEDSLIEDGLNYFVIYSTALDDGQPVYVWVIGGGHMTQSSLYDATKFTTRAFAEKRLEIVRNIKGFQGRSFDIIEVDRRIFGTQPRSVVNYDAGWISEDELNQYNFTDKERKIIRQNYFNYPSGYFRFPTCALG